VAWVEAELKGTMPATVQAMDDATRAAPGIEWWVAWSFYPFAQGRSERKQEKYIE
jgi:hypothetical protein